MTAYHDPSSSTYLVRYRRVAVEDVVAVGRRHHRPFLGHSMLGSFGARRANPRGAGMRRRDDVRQRHVRDSGATRGGRGRCQIPVGCDGTLGECSGARQRHVIALHSLRRTFHCAWKKKGREDMEGENRKNRKAKEMGTGNAKLAKKEKK